MALFYSNFPQFLLLFGGLSSLTLLAQAVPRSPPHSVSKKAPSYGTMWNDLGNNLRWCGRAYKITKHSPYYNDAAAERVPRIIGGFHVDDPIPWQAIIEKETFTGEWQHICGGSLISEYHILTASHCISSNSNNRYRVTLGKHLLHSFCPSQQSYIIKPTNIVTHRRYGAGAEHANDIAILRIEQPNGNGARLNDRVHPICLPNVVNWEAQMMEPNSGECIVSGFGSINGSTPDALSSTLRATLVPIHSQRRCNGLYNSAKLARGGYRGSGKVKVADKPQGYGGSPQFVDDMLCAGPLTGRKDHCFGDSGGPLACKHNGRYFLVGLVSWGSDCGEPHKPGLYTRVSHYLTWIKNEKSLLGPAEQ